MAERPVVEIVFKQQASTLIERSGEFPVVLFVKAESGTIWKELNYLSEYDEDDLGGTLSDPDTVSDAIKYCFASNPKKVILTSYGFDDTWARLKSGNMTNCIMTKASSGGASKSDLAINATSVANNENCGCTFVVKDSYATPLLRDMHYIQIADNVTYYNTNDEELSDYAINCLYAGAIAACGVDRSLTNYTLPLISSIVVGSAVANTDTTANGIISAEMMSGKARVIAGINTAEISDDVTEDMQHIEVVQTMDTIRKDITDTFVEYYRGAYKNNYANQLLFIAAVNGYFDDLENEEVLDPEFDNICEIDVDELRQAWLDYGKSEAEDWSDDKVKQMSFGRRVILKADIKVCQSMEDLYMYITLE